MRKQFFNKRKFSVIGIFFTFAITIAYAQPPLSPSLPSSSVQHAATAQFPQAGTLAKSHLDYRVMDAANHTYCYDIYANGELMIHQVSIPGVPGNEGFKTKSDATKVALLVIDKIKKGEMPPTISIDEMKKFNIIQ